MEIKVHWNELSLPILEKDYYVTIKGDKGYFDRIVHFNRVDGFYIEDNFFPKLKCENVVAWANIPENASWRDYPSEYKGHQGNLLDKCLEKLKNATPEDIERYKKIYDNESKNIIKNCQFEFII